MKKFIVLLIFLCSLSFIIAAPAPTSVCAENFGEIKVITNLADVFDSPSDSGNKLFVAKHKDKFALAQSDVIASGEQQYYKIVVEGFNEAYIKAHQVLVVNQKNICNLVKPNAYFNKKIKEADLFSSIDGQYQKFCTIQTNSKIPIRIVDGFDRKKQFTEIQIMLDDEVVNVYVETKNIKPYGIPVWLKVILYILSSLLVGALITWLTIHLKRAKNKLVNSKT